MNSPHKTPSNRQHVTVHVSAGSIFKTFLILIFFLVLFILRDLLLIVLTAVVIASAIEPITRWFIRYRISRLPAVIFIYLGVLFILTGAFYFLLLPLLNETSGLLINLPDYLSSVDVWSPTGSESFIGSQPFVQGLSESFSLQEIIGDINRTLSNFSEGFWSAVSVAFGGLLSFVLILVLSFYLAVQEHGIANFLRMVTPTSHEAYVLNLWGRAERKIGLWMQGQLLLVVIVATLVFLGLTLLGIEHALLLAVLAGLFEVIPLFGPILAAIPAVMIAFLTGGLTPALLVVGLYLIIQQFENQLIYPLVVRKVVGLSPVIVILALIAGGTLAGFLGILLAVPVAAVLMEFFNDIQVSRSHPEPVSTPPPAL